MEPLNNGKKIKEGKERRGKGWDMMVLFNNQGLV